MSNKWKIGGKEVSSRMLLGTARYPSPAVLKGAVEACKTEIVTVSLRRHHNIDENSNQFWEVLKGMPVNILPNTAGCNSVKEAVTTAKMAREVFNTSWIKLEVIGDDYNLQPDPFGLVEAADILTKDGFTVFPYMTDDLVLAERLLNVGCEILMPWASPIGSGKGIINPLALKTLRQRFPNVPIIIDAGLGKPSHAAEAMEMGFDGILLNSAVALAAEPVAMALAFSQALDAGRTAARAGVMPERDFASPSTPVLGTPFWHGEKPDGTPKP